MTEFNKNINKLDSVELANYVIQYSQGRGYGVSHLKLQKLIYFIEAYHLAYFEKPLIDDEFEAWVHGPVSRKIYSSFVGQSQLYDGVEPTGEPKIQSQITQDQFEMINDVLDEFVAESGYNLEKITHGEQPWKDARLGCGPTESCNEIIPKDSIKALYETFIYGEA